jgi:hypothetical protein
MSHFRQKLAQEIVDKGKEIDEMIMRLQKMEEEMKLVLGR